MVHMCFFMQKSAKKRRKNNTLNQFRIRQKIHLLISHTLYSAEYMQVFEYYKGLIAFRKAHRERDSFYKFFIRLLIMFYFYPVKVWYINNTSYYGRLRDMLLRLPAHGHTGRRQFGEVEDEASGYISSDCAVTFFAHQHRVHCCRKSCGRYGK